MTPPPATTTDSQSPAAATATSAPRSYQIGSQHSSPPPRSANSNADGSPKSTNAPLGWGPPAGLGIRDRHDENLLVFRRALGINCHGPSPSAPDGGTLEEARASSVGIYAEVIRARRSTARRHALLTGSLHAGYFLQVIVGAVLTSLGGAARDYPRAITALGALNTAVAGALALVKGSGQPESLGRSKIAYRRLQDWIEETEALLQVGVIGRDEREVGLLVESAFRRFNAAKANEENNDPDYYVSQPMDPSSHPGADGFKNGVKIGGDEAEVRMMTVMP
ncbi:hypothetical protein GGR56DRAFT_668497 [Xylariaceae sp. FL0804]|nr:hypothetical protein GGR56DRAFT_668497 [Xylariaceae sp. FL0804]